MSLQYSYIFYTYLLRIGFRCRSYPGKCEYGGGRCLHASVKDSSSDIQAPNQMYRPVLFQMLT
jgi:hypothetical protein